MKTLWSDIRDIYGSAWAFAFACPLLFMIPVVFEFAQHVVEINSGLYLSRAAASAAADDPARMAWGFVKTLALGLPTYWFYRYVISGRNAAYARRLDRRALLLWGSIFLVMAVGLGWLGLFGPDIGKLLGLQGGAAMSAKAILATVEQIISIYFTAWFVAWSQGNAAIGPARSFQIMNGFFWRTVALMAAGIIPLMALHYAGLFTIGRPEPVVWAAMAFDSLVVGFLALTMHGASAVAARCAAAAKGVSLLQSRGAVGPEDARTAAAHA